MKNNPSKKSHKCRRSRKHRTSSNSILQQKRRKRIYKFSYSGQIEFPNASMVKDISQSSLLRCENESENKSQREKLVDKINEATKNFQVSFPSNSRYRSIKTIPKKSENSHTQMAKTSMRVSPVFKSPSVEKVSRSICRIARRKFFLSLKKIETFKARRIVLLE
jgi:hypothetical protein